MFESVFESVLIVFRAVGPAPEFLAISWTLSIPLLGVMIMKVLYTCGPLSDKLFSTEDNGWLGR